VAKFAARPALDYRDWRIAYAELGALADRAAAAFLRLGARSVALYLPNAPWHPVTFFGALKAGAHVAHLSPLDAERELAWKLKDSGADTLVTLNHPLFLERAAKL